MLTALASTPYTSAAELPPLYDQQPFVAAILAGHGNYEFTSDNEVMYFGDEPMQNG